MDRRDEYRDLKSSRPQRRSCRKRGWVYNVPSLRYGCSLKISSIIFRGSSGCSSTGGFS